MIKFFIVISFFAAGILNMYAQQNVGIGTLNPEPNSVLHIQPPNNDKGLLIPRLSDIQMNAIPVGANDNGMLIFNTSANVFYFWDNTATIWQPFPNTNSDSQTLSLVGGILTIQNGNSVIIDDIDSTNELIQSAVIQNEQIIITEAGNIFNIQLQDLDSTNELIIGVTYLNDTLYIEQSDSIFKVPIISDTSEWVDGNNYSNGGRIYAKQAKDNSQNIVITDNADLGVGNDNPSEKLHVTGRARIEDKPAGTRFDSIVLRDGDGVLHQISFSRFAQILCDTFDFAKTCDIPVSTNGCITTKISCNEFKTVCPYSGIDQQVTLLEDIDSVRIKVWGAGGGGCGNSATYQLPGGAGGYSSEMILSPINGTDYSVVVGQGGGYLFPAATGNAYGYGGASGADGGGGGLSGVFTGNTNVLNTDAARSIVVAGGGGGGNGEVNIANSNAGLPANGAGGSVSMQGQDGAGNNGGGGGGFSGGNTAVTLEGNGGSGFGAIQQVGVGITPPSTVDPDYVVGVGEGASAHGIRGGNGLVVFYWYK